MLKPSPDQLAKTIIDGLWQAYEEGAIEPDESGDLRPPFDPAQVAGLHTHKTGVGDGVWYRLTDGRVFNAYFEPDDRARSLYDTVEN